MRLRFAIIFAVATLAVRVCTIEAQNSANEFPPMPNNVFGYADFALQSRVDRQFLTVPDAKLAGEELKTLTAKPHLAATKEDLETANYVAEKFREAGLETEIVPYRVLLNQPRKVAFEATTDSGTPIASGPTREHVSSASNPDPFQDDPRVVMPFNGSSGSGNVSGEVVYANYGRLEDFDQLAAQHVDLHGKIVLVRYGANFRGVKVYIAEQRGAYGVLIYSDPQDDGYFKGDTYPNGPWRPETGVQRGSVEYLFKYPGDPQTPGVASTVELPDSARQDARHTGNQPNIISIPISYRDAEPILKALGGPPVPAAWQGALPFHYHVGGSGVRVHLISDQDYQVRTIWDVIGKIKGTQYPDDWVVVGNHRDAWVYGAVDPNSGTASMLEAVHGFGALLKSGWKPKRTIVVASWDAEEEGLIGSTEWVEQHAKALEQAVAYFNVDVAVAGTDFGAEAVPSLKQFVREVTREVPSPKSGTLYYQWKLSSIGEEKDASTGHVTHANAPTEDVEVGDLGSGSDFTPFLQHVGVPSTDIGSHGDYGVYHSVFDNYAWFTQNADPSFVYLQEMARVLGLEALHMADTDVLPYDYVTYGKEITSYLETAKKKATAASLDFAPALSACARFTAAAEAIRKRQLATTADPAPLNRRLRETETDFIAQSGLPNRVWYKHTIYAPGEFTGYSAVVIPGVNEALDAKSPAVAAQQLTVLTEALNKAAHTLESGE
jgi:N-acetylated-alpha-linked acidic dipeptidase